MGFAGKLQLKTFRFLYSGLLLLFNLECPVLFSLCTDKGLKLEISIGKKITELKRAPSTY
jgi:hypothetical protein